MLNRVVDHRNSGRKPLRITRLHSTGSPCITLVTLPPWRYFQNGCQKQARTMLSGTISWGEAWPKEQNMAQTAAQHRIRSGRKPKPVLLDPEDERLLREIVESPYWSSRQVRR